MQSHALRRLRLSERGLEAQLEGCDEVTVGEVQGNMWHVATALSPRLLVTSGNSSCHKIYHNACEIHGYWILFQHMGPSWVIQNKISIILMLNVYSGFGSLKQQWHIADYHKNLLWHNF